MNVEDLILVSVDDHVIEPAGMFDAHIPSKYRERAPRVLIDTDGSEYWQFEDERAAYMGLNAVAGCPPEEYGLNPTRYDQMRPGCYDVHERVKDMRAALAPEYMAVGTENRNAPAEITLTIDAAGLSSRYGRASWARNTGPRRLTS